MRATTQRQLATLIMMGAVAGGLTAFGCSLGLDASLIHDDGGESSDGMMSAEGSEGSAQDGPAGNKDARADSEAGGPTAVGQCSTDKDCASAIGDAGGCVASAKCDTTWHVCMLDVCQSATACQAEVCVAATNSCSLPASYGFQAGSFKVSYGGVGGWSPSRAIAAVWPFVFVVTNNGAIAYNVVDPTTTMPPQVPIHGVPFLPDTAISVGRRVYFVRGQEGPGPTFHDAVAWIDVPQNPFLTDLVASSAWLSDANTKLDNVFTNGVDGLFFVYTSTPQWPSANVHPPLSDSTAITTFASNNFPMNAGIWGSTGSRLFTSRYDANPPGTPQPTPNTFWGAFVTAPGTMQAQTTSEQQITGVGEVDNQGYTTTGDDGSVLMSMAPLDVTDAGPDGIASSCVTWLIDNGTTGNFDASKCPALETYSPLASGAVTGPPGWIDKNTALALAGASSNPNSNTSVHVVTKSPPAVEKNKVAYLPVATGATGVATSNGFGYVLVQDDMMNQTCSVYVFAPACSAGGD